MTLKAYERQQHKNTLMVSLHLAATLNPLFTHLVLIYNSWGQANTAVAPLHIDMNMLKPGLNVVKLCVCLAVCLSVCVEYLPENTLVTV